MGAYPGDGAVYLTVAIATHGLVGYTLATFFDRSLVGLVGGTVADIDLLVPASWGDPFVHRGLTHALVVPALFVALLAQRDRSAASAFGVAYVSHLAIDSTTPQGVPAAWPVSDAYVGVVFNGHSPSVTALLWACCLGVLGWRHWRKR